MSGRSFAAALALLVATGASQGEVLAQPAGPALANTSAVGPGDCNYIVDGIKECYPTAKKGFGRFKIKTFPGVITVISWPELSESIVITSAFFKEVKATAKTKGKAKGQRTLKIQAIFPDRLLEKGPGGKLSIPAAVTARILTQSYTIIFDFELAASAREADVQIDVVPFDQRGKDVQCQRRIEDARDALAGTFAPRVKRASRKAIMRGLVDLKTGNLRGELHGKPARKNHVIITPRRWVRIDSLYLEVELKNRKGSFHIEKLILERGRGKNRRGVGSDWRCGRRRLSTDQITRCWVRADQEPKGDNRFYVTVEARGGRTARSGGFHVR